MMDDAHKAQHNAVVNIYCAYLNGTIATTDNTKPLFEALGEALKRTASFDYRMAHKFAAEARELARPSQNYLHPAGERGQMSRAPTRPGVIFRDIVLPATGLSVGDVAQAIGVSRQTLHAIMSGRSGITAEMSLRLGKFCGNGPNLWLSMQCTFDLFEANKAIGHRIEAIPTYRVAGAFEEQQ